MNLYLFMTDCLDLQHALFLRTFDDNLGFAPSNDPNADVKNVLDIGTGTGIWAIDFADEHPGAEVRLFLSSVSFLADLMSLLPCRPIKVRHAMLTGLGHRSRSVPHPTQLVGLPQ